MERENKNPELDEMMKTKLNLEDKDAKKDENDVENMNFNEFLDEFLRQGRVVLASNSTNLKLQVLSKNLFYRPSRL